MGPARSTLECMDESWMAYLLGKALCQGVEVQVLPSFSHSFERREEKEALITILSLTATKS